VARAREVQGLDCDGPFARAAMQVIAVRADEVLEQGERVVAGADAEAVHDMRVATRRLRAALEMFEPCLPRKRRRRVRKRLEGLADALGERRDCDVAIELLRGVETEVAEADRPQLAGLVERLGQRRRRADVELSRAVSRKRLRKLRHRVAELLEAELV
jgi:CHAD domain-containing protein